METKNKSYGLSIAVISEELTKLLAECRKREHEVIMDETITSKAHSKLVDAITHIETAAVRLQSADRMIENSFLRK